MSGELHVEHNEKVEVWTLDFPPVNAIGPALLDALENRLDVIERDAEVAVVVLASALRIFSAGADARWIADLVEVKGIDQLVSEFEKVMDRFRNVCLRLRRSPTLFIAALGGHTLAGGLELAAACDLRFAADDDRIQIGAPEMRLFGVLPSGGGGAQFLSRVMGPSRCLEFLLRAEPCPPAEAISLGLIDRLVPRESLIVETRAFASQIANRAGRVGINAAKRSILDGSSLPIYEAMEWDRAVHWDSMRRGGFIAGISEFIAQFGGGDDRR